MSAPMTKKVRCCDCGDEKEIPVDHTTPPGWYYLYITGRIRCMTCVQALETVNHPQEKTEP